MPEPFSDLPLSDVQTEHTAVEAIIDEPITKDNINEPVGIDHEQVLKMNDDDFEEVIFSDDPTSNNQIIEVKKEACNEKVVADSVGESIFEENDIQMVDDDDGRMVLGESSAPEKSLSVANICPDQKVCVTCLIF